MVLIVSEQGLPFDSPYQSYEYMAKMEQHFREKIAKEIELSPPMLVAKDHVEAELVEFIIGKCAAIARGANV